MNQNKFNIGDAVYHVTPESDKGIVIEIVYMFSTRTYVYTVATSWNTEYTCQEHELTDHPNF